MPATMPTLHDAALGKVIFTSRASGQMRHYGLKPFHITETLKYGQPIDCFYNHGLLQLVYIFDQFKQVDVVVTTTYKNGKPADAIFVLTCRAKTIR